MSPTIIAVIAAVLGLGFGAGGVAVYNKTKEKSGKKALFHTRTLNLEKYGARGGT